MSKENMKEMENVELAIVIRELMEEKKNAEKDMIAAERLLNEYKVRFKSLEKAVYTLQEKDLSTPVKKRPMGSFKARSFDTNYEDWK